MKIITFEEIERILPGLNLLPDIEEGFAAYSKGKAVVPPVGELILEKGEAHIKYGYLLNDEFYVIKIASGFYQNPQIGLSSSNGLMLLFGQNTGELVAILLDQGRLTDVRTAVAGAIAAKYLAPRRIKRIGMVGTGIQGRQQLIQLKNVTDCREVLAWGKFEDELPQFEEDLRAEGFQIETTRDTALILRHCNLVVTCTPSTQPLLFARDLQPGTHITAVGSDTPEKQELDSEILAQADLVVADSIAQCLLRGEIFQALKAEKIQQECLIELGAVISGSVEARNDDEQITIADLTGVAVQDIKIATALFQASTT